MATSSISGKVAIITGASSGIGRGIAVNFARQGCKLCITGRDVTALMLTKGLCVAKGLSASSVLPIVADMMKNENVEEIVKKTVEKFEKLDILVHNAGTLRCGAEFEDYPQDWYHETMQVNTHSVVLLTKLAVPHLEKTKGSITAISSLNAKRALPKLWSYNMSKAAVDHFCRSISVDLAPKGIRVNTVNPGVVVTCIQTRGATPLVPLENYEGFLEAAGGLHALNRIADVSEIASVVSFLVSDKASYTTGATVLVDGGWSVMDRTWRIGKMNDDLNVVSETEL